MILRVPGRGAYPVAWSFILPVSVVCLSTLDIVYHDMTLMSSINRTNFKNSHEIYLMFYSVLYFLWYNDIDAIDSDTSWVPWASQQ